MTDRQKRVNAAGEALCPLHSELRTQSGRILQFKGLAGGVPPNTERTTVNPWVGI